MSGLLDTRRGIHFSRTKEATKPLNISISIPKSVIRRDLQSCKNQETGNYHFLSESHVRFSNHRKRNREQDQVRSDSKNSMSISQSQHYGIGYTFAGDFPLPESTATRYAALKYGKEEICRTVCGKDDEDRLYNYSLTPVDQDP
jgi:hypothetical protein